MTILEDLTTGSRVSGLTGTATVTVESVQWIGGQAVKVIFRDAQGHLGERLLEYGGPPCLS